MPALCAIRLKVNSTLYKEASPLTNELTDELNELTALNKELIKFYCNRGRMENFIKESKNGFAFDFMSSSSKLVNSNRLQISMLAYNIFNWFRRLALPGKMCKLQIDTIRLKLIKIASRVIRSARYTIFKICSNCPYKAEFYEILVNIRNLKFYPKLE